MQQVGSATSAKGDVRLNDAKTRLEKLCQLAGFAGAVVTVERSNLGDMTAAVSHGEKFAIGYIFDHLNEVEDQIQEWPGCQIIGWRAASTSYDVNPVVRAAPERDDYGYEVDLKTGHRSGLLFGRGPDWESVDSKGAS